MNVQVAGECRSDHAHAITLEMETSVNSNQKNVCFLTDLLRNAVQEKPQEAVLRVGKSSEWSGNSSLDVPDIKRSWSRSKVSGCYIMQTHNKLFEFGM